MLAKLKIRDGYVRICSIAKDGMIALFNSEGRNAIVFTISKGRTPALCQNQKAACPRFVTMNMHNARHVSNSKDEIVALFLICSNPDVRTVASFQI